MGRKPKNPEELRDVDIHIRVNQAEAAEIDAAADAMGLVRASFVRWALIRKSKAVKK